LNVSSKRNTSGDIFCQTYTVQARAVGGSTGYSDWSDPVSHMAM
jgi:hypothetical protein